MSRDRVDWNEPSIEDLLSDPITWAVMKSDKVEEAELRYLLGRVAADLAAAGDGASEHANVAAEDGGYRKGVGIMLLNDSNQVFVGQRADSLHEAWQMPQGGINDGESPRDAAFRELKEEIGTNKARVVAESRQWLRYDLPNDLRIRWSGHERWSGQQQKWFVMRFEGSETDIDVATEHPEFSAWKWVPLDQLPGLIVCFKKQLYVDLVAEFGRFR